MTKILTKNKETEKAETIPTISNLFEKVGQEKFYKTKQEIAEIMLQFFKSKNVTINIKGELITLEKLTSQVNSMIRDIVKKTGPRKWANFELDKKEDGTFKIKLREKILGLKA